VDREKAKSILQRDGCLYYESWTWSYLTFTCGGYEDGSECCYETFSTIDEMLDQTEQAS